MTRSRWDFLYEILAFLGIHKEVVRTRIERHIVMTSSNMKKYFGMLLNGGYMTMNEEDYGKRKMYVCSPTPKGLELRDKIKEIYDLFGGKRPKW